MAYNNQAIGEYIHARTENYRRYGISRNGPKSITASAALTNSHKQLMNLINAQDKNIDSKVLSEYLTNFYYGNMEDIDYDLLAYSAADIVSLKNDFIAQLQNKWPIFKANLTNLSLIGTGQELTNTTDTYLYKGVGGSGNAKHVTQNMKQETANKIVKAVQHLLYVTDRMTEDVNKGVAADISILKKYKIQCEEDIVKIQDMIDKYLDKNRHNQIAIRYKNNKLNPLGKMIAALNKFIKSGTKPNPIDLGDLAEMGIAMAIGVGSSTIKKSLGELINQQTIVGDQRTPTTYNRYGELVYTDVLVNDLNKNEYGSDKWGHNYKTYRLNADGFVGTVKGSQDTVDIDINLDDNSLLGKELGLDNIKASVKNYNDALQQSGVHILSGSPIPAVLELESTDFINHYLNLLVSNSSFSEKLKDYTEEVKFAGVARGLSGLRSTATFGRYSDCFIVNDRKHSCIRVWGTKELLKEAEKCRDMILSAKGNNIPNLGDLKNDWYTKTGISKKYIEPDYAMAGIRITKLISQLHQYKLYLALDLNKVTS